MAITVKTVLTTVNKLTVVKMVFASTLAQTSIVTVEEDTSENTANWKLTSV